MGRLDVFYTIYRFVSHFLGNLQVHWSFFRQFTGFSDNSEAIFRFVSRFLGNLQVRWSFFRKFTGFSDNF